MDPRIDDSTTSGRPLPPPATAAIRATPPALSSIPLSAVGRLVGTWRLLLALAWMAGFFAYAAVWQASVQLGIGLWWVGPRAQPTPGWLRLLPFAICLTIVVLVGYGVRRLPATATVAAVVLVAFASPDFSRSVGLAATELAVGLTLLVVSALSATGRIRLSSPGDAAHTSGPPGGPVTDG